METTTTHHSSLTGHFGPLTAEMRTYLRRQIDSTIRGTLSPPRPACPECGTDQLDASRPVIGCTACRDRLWRRRQRARRH